MAQSKSSNAKKKNSSTSSTVKSNSRSKTAPAAQEAPIVEPVQPIRREITAIVFFLLALFTSISYFNTDGVFIRQFSELMRGLLGYGFWLLGPCFLLIGIIFFNHKGRPVSMRVTAAFVLPLLFSAIVHLFIYVYPAEIPSLEELAKNFFSEGLTLDSGGALGGLLSYGLESAFSVYGALPVLLISFILCFLFSINSSFKAVAGKMQNRPKYDPAYYEKREIERKRDETQNYNSSYNDIVIKTDRNTREYAKPDYSFDVDIPLGNEVDELSLLESVPPEEYIPVSKTARRKVQTKVKADVPKNEAKPLTPKESEIFDNVFEVIKNMPPEEPKPVPEPPKKVKPAATEISDPPKREPAKVKRISRDEINAEAQAVASAVESSAAGEGYKYPPVTLLRSSNAGNIDARDEIRINRERLENALHSFGISAKIVGVIHGPTVTRYDIELEQGVKLARITNLSGDLALSLGVVNVRIAPIPDKISTVGIEVPNKIVSTVYLRDIIDSPKFSGAKSKLSFAIGKDISGEGVVGNIAKLPHLLIAGTTGSGKSVCMNSLILSLLYKASPEEVRLIMIDPKMVELGIYNGIPHLYVPVVTDPKKAAGALQWSVVEMLKRYRYFADAGVRDLEHYNMHCRKNNEPTMPQIVIVIDELADLMLVASKDVEESICRVAQMGRAAGMHLVIATQRPSADVITGLMKANIPSRIAFAVSSAMESRIILDAGGAEKLIGMGDMLFSPVGSGKPTRIQGAFVSDEEREDVITFIKENCTSTGETNSELVDFMNASKDKDSKEASNDNKSESGLPSEYDEMLPQAVEVVIETKSCSVSMLQRRIKLGYSRAARIVDQMEELGVVGPFEGAKSRQVLVDRDGWRAIQRKLGMVADDEMSMAAEMNEESDYSEDYDE